MTPLNATLKLALLGAAFVACLVAILTLAGLLAIEYTVRRKLPSILDSAQTATREFASASESLKDVARKQDRYLDQTSRELNKTVADAHDLLIHTDIALNGRNGRGGLLPSARALASDQESQLDALEARSAKSLADLDAAERQIQPILASLDEAAGSAADATNSLARTAGNPRIADCLERLDRALAESDAALANLQAISASGNRDAAMIEVRLRQALKPASLLKSALLRVLGVSSSAAPIVSALH